MLVGCLALRLQLQLKGVFAKNERWFRLMAINNRFWLLLILLLSVASIWRKLLKTSHTEDFLWAKQKERGTSTQRKGDCALSYNGTKRATHKNSFKSSAINGKGRQEKKKLQKCRWIKEKKWTFEIINLASYHFIL